MLLLRIGSLFLLVSSALSQKEDPYKVLGISRRASAKEIKSAYKSLAREW